MRKGKALAFTSGALIVVLAGLAVPLMWAADTPKEASATTPANLTAIHDPDSDRYNDNCLSCHASILKERSKDPRILAFHQAMLPYTPGFNARKGAENKHCVTCHREKIDFTQESGASLRRSVSIESCVYCHRRSGPGPAYYR